MSWPALYAELVTCTGMTWDEVRHGLDLPAVAALYESWQTLPPAAVALRRISARLGIEVGAPPKRTPSATNDPLRELAAVGLPVMGAAPNDPMLSFIED